MTTKFDMYKNLHEDMHKEQNNRPNADTLSERSVTAKGLKDITMVLANNNVELSVAMLKKAMSIGITSPKEVDLQRVSQAVNKQVHSFLERNYQTKLQQTTGLSNDTPTNTIGKRPGR
jgi:hypothetical protein